MHKAWQLFVSEMDIVRFKGFNLEIPVHVVLPDVGHVEQLLGAVREETMSNVFSTKSLVMFLYLIR